MRRPRVHAAFARLALVAMLLLAIVPTAGRVAGGGHALHAAPVVVDAQRVDAHHDMGHHEGAHHAATAPPAPATPTPPAPNEGDCEYCPLLSGLVAFTLPPVALDALAATTHAPAPRAFAPRTLHVPGLGARGPPTPDA